MSRRERLEIEDMLADDPIRDEYARAQWATDREPRIDAPTWAEAQADAAYFGELG